MNPEILNYIKQNMAAGKTKEQILEDLKRAGWQENDAKKALEEFGLAENRPMPPSPPAASKTWGGKETVSLVFLVLFPLVGLILMWAIANWSQKVKIIISIVLFLPFIAMIGIFASVVLVSIGGAREKAVDAVTKSDMRQIVTAQEMYYSEHSQYYQSAVYPQIITGFIEFAMPASKYVQYGWIDNTEDSQGFCAYGELKKGGYYIASHAGPGEVTTRPYQLSDCEMVSYYSY